MVSVFHVVRLYYKVENTTSCKCVEALKSTKLSRLFVLVLIFFLIHYLLSLQFATKLVLSLTNNPRRHLSLSSTSFSSSPIIQISFKNHIFLPHSLMGFVPSGRLSLTIFGIFSTFCLSMWPVYLNLLSLSPLPQLYPVPKKLPNPLVVFYSRNLRNKL